MKTPLLLSCAAAVLAGPPHAAAEPEPQYTLRIVAQESVPPKWLPREGSLPAGVCPDILAAIEKIQPRLRFSGMEEARSVPVIEQGLESGGVGAACALLDTPRRRQIASVAGKSLYTVRHRLAAAASDKVNIETLEELVRLRPLINTPRGAAYSDQLRILGLEVDDSTGDNLTNLRKIAAGHGRFIYMNELTLAWLIREHNLQNKVRLLPNILKEEPIYFWISKKADPMATRLADQALHRLHSSGELARIYQRWSSQRQP
ncbi:ABC transporter substrate-binding protein [Massilia sp. BJB1822]|uniref:substrate-binding periplasmic protein n=1 Tax=Massilia sp. BJB1822 TaxID=2744470 RepID=UPI001594B663|nr:transporter substrate-binding domain-containing protein [Massilia sp. BJB1822]NVD97377.1 transporter substrate-binding domain-containing protein [Massilia sp. BJB1822]